MLDTKSKQILSFLKPYALKNSDVRIKETTIAENIPELNLNEIMNALDYLNENGYLTLIKTVGPSWTVGHVTHKGINFEEFEQQITPSQTFNINSVNNSAFGNNGNITINNGYTFEEIRSLISTTVPIEEQKKLNDLVDTVEIVTKNSSSISKGFLSNFSDLMQKHSPIVVALIPHIINWLTTNH
mgnify:CR=1 FL=1